MKVFSNTNIGLVRSSNQDTFKQGVLTEGCLWTLVCDGMGGVSGGNIASALAAEVIEQELNEKLESNMDAEALRRLSFKVISAANTQVFARAVDEPALKGMGTTAVLAIVSNGKLHLSHVGDSRAYLIRNTKVWQLTTDHSFVQDLVSRGEITREEARTHPNRNIITRVVGVHSMVDSEYQQMELKPGDVFLSCSDGLSNYMTDEKLAQLINELEPENAADGLIQFALDCGGSDNVTVSIIYI